MKIMGDPSKNIQVININTTNATGFELDKNVSRDVYRIR
jgi:hypothetical protein